MTREEYLALFKQLTDRMNATTATKNHDYGGATDPFKNFHKRGEKGILIRMDDKMARLDSAIWEDRLLKVADESVEDTLIDLATYSLLLIAYLRSKRVE
jgi:hypothetical protein